jgi:hypothetical protein
MATVSSLGASSYQQGYDIHVTVTYNGHASAPFPIKINTPFTMTTSLPGEYCRSGACGCAALGFPAGSVGYANAVKHGVAAQGGSIMTPIILNESLEKQQTINSTYPALHPTATPWDTSLWNIMQMLRAPARWMGFR